MSFANPTQYQMTRLEALDNAYNLIMGGFHKIASPLEFYVYCLYRTDTNEPVYIGKGKGRRVFNHMMDFAAGRIKAKKKHAGLLRLNRLGIKVGAKAIVDGLSSNAAYELESDLIQKIGVSNLLNSTTSRGNSDRMAIEQAKWCLSHLNPKMKNLAMYKKIQAELIEVIGLAKMNLKIDGLKYE